MKTYDYKWLTSLHAIHASASNAASCMASCLASDIGDPKIGREVSLLAVVQAADVLRGCCNISTGGCITKSGATVLTVIGQGRLPIALARIKGLGANLPHSKAYTLRNDNQVSTIAVCRFAGRGAQLADTVSGSRRQAVVVVARRSALEVIQQAYASFKRGDLPGLLDLCTDDTE